MDRFVIGDIHGDLDKLNALLRTWHVDKERLVFLGDFVDRGPNSYGVLKRVQELHHMYGAEAVSGNHDLMLLDWLDSPEYVYYYSQGGRETINSFFEESMVNIYRPDYIAKIMKEKFAETIEFIRSLPAYIEWRDYVFVHAGAELDILDWRETSPIDFRWIREDFHYGENKTGKTFVFGHTPTRYLNSDESSDVWVSDCKTKIGIDGGAVFNGQLHGLKISPDRVVGVHSVQPDLEIKVIQPLLK